MENSDKKTAEARRSTVVVFDRKLLKSKAFLKLSGSAVQVLLIFLSKRIMGKIPQGKRKEWVITNNGKITFYYSEAEEKYSISRGAFNRAIKQLVEYGFIDIARPSIGWARIPTLYTISDRWKKYGTEQFVEINKKPRKGNKF